MKALTLCSGPPVAREASESIVDIFDSISVCEYFFCVARLTATETCKKSRSIG